MIESIDAYPLQLSIVIPVYNEHENIKKTMHSIERDIKVPHEIITVYDQENDTTLPVLNRLKEQHANLSIVKNITYVAFFKLCK